MTHWYKFLFFYLWIAPHLLLMIVAALLLKRRLYTSFPAFTFYTCYEIAEFALLLAFGVLQEIFNNIFREHVQLHALARVSLRWTTGLLVAAAVLGAILEFAQTSDSAIADVAWLGRGIALIQCGLVLFLLLFSRLFGLSLQSYVFGIALGFGILSSVEIANWALHAGELTDSMARALNLLPTGGYHVAVLVWIGYLVAPARKVLQPSDVPVDEVDQWNRELERFLQ